MNSQLTQKKHLNIVTGFLGSGKTSLILNFLKSKPNKNERVFILINEMGKENFDQIKFSQNSNENNLSIVNVPGGCICCSSKMDFSKNLFEIAEREDFDRIIIEPSGLARASEVIDLIDSTRLKEIFIVHSVICITHPQWPIQANEMWKQQILDQLDAAQIVISNFNDKVDPTYEIAFEEFLMTRSTPKQKYLKSSYGKIDPSLFDLMPNSTSSRPLYSNFSTKGFKSTQMAWPKDRKISFEILCKEIIRMKAEYEIVRMKSYFHTDRGWFCFEMNQDTYFCEPTEYRIDQRIQIISTKEVNLNILLQNE
jgi:G3E family GTPase